jgi:hypothetical protein
MKLPNVYLALAVLGALVPYVFFADFLRAQSPTTALPAFLSALFANGAVGGFTADILIASLVFWTWMAQDLRERARAGGAGADARRMWPFVVLNLGIGLSCALPAYLWARSRAGSSA